MQTKMKLLLFALISVTILNGCSCSSEVEEESTIIRQNLYKMAIVGDDTLHFKAPSSVGETLVNCYEYIPKCKYGYIIIVKELEMKVLEYSTVADAKRSAKRINGWRRANWVFDDVEGEPVLEWYIKKYLDANPAE